MEASTGDLMDSLTVSVKDTSSCLKEVSIEVSPDRMRTEYGRTLEEFRAKATIPGFRRGHAPLPMVQARYAADVREEVKDRMMSRALGEVLEARGLDPIGNPRVVGDVDYRTDGPLVFQAQVEVEPVLPDVDWSGLKGRRPRTETDEQEVEAEVNRLRELHAELSPVERGAEPGDLLIVDYERVDTDKVEEKGEPASDVMIELGDPGLLPEMEAGLRGAVKGSLRRIKIHYPDQFRDPELAGREVELSVTVKELKEKRLPPLDDDFARAAAGCESMSELRERIREAVRHARERAAERALDQSLFDALIARTSFDVPPSLVMSVVEDMARATEERTGTPPDFKDERVRQLFLRMAEREVRRMFLSREIVKKASLQVAETEVDERARLLAAEYARERGAGADEVLGALQSQESRERIADRIMDEKIVQLLRESAEVEDVSPA